MNVVEETHSNQIGKGANGLDVANMCATSGGYSVRDACGKGQGHRMDGDPAVMHAEFKNPRIARIELTEEAGEVLKPRTVG
jgi:hypothetical protein